MNKILNLHTNTEYSLLGSTISLDGLIDYAVTNELSHLVISDHNNLYGVPAFYEKCLSKDIKPIIGIDLDVESFRIILLAKNYVGFLEISRLSSFVKSEKTISFADIDDTNLITIDHPRLGLFAKTKRIPENLKNYFVIGDNISDEHTILVKENVIMKKEHNKLATKILSFLKGEKFNEIEYAEFSSFSEANPIIVKRTNDLINQIDFKFPLIDTQTVLPIFDLNKNSNDLLKEKLIEAFAKNKVLKNYPEAQDRLNYEYNVIAKLGYADYFLIIWDLVKWANSQGIYVGPGRGSAAGSLVSYLLKITRINPLEYGLIFERFLNPKRVSLPDIDLDFENIKRDLVIEYVQIKYGKEHVASINTFQRMAAKSSIRDVARYLEFSQAEVNQFIKLIPKDASLKEAYKSNIFRAKVESNEKYTMLYENALILEGFPRQHGTHAAGIVLSRAKLNKIVPTMLNGTFLQTQFSMDYLEQFGLLKVDILGLKNLTITKTVIELINEKYGIDVKLSKIPLNDTTTFNLLSTGKILGIFQLESHGMTKTLKDAKVSKFLDIVDVISLFRPGPMAFIPKYISIKKGLTKMTPLIESYDSVVLPTNGIIIYQEQIMQISQDFAGMSYAEADILRKAISKKDDALFEISKKTFINSAIENKQNACTAVQIFNQIEKFARYGFNKSHAVAYGMLAYWMAYLKANFILEFYSSLLSNETSLESIKKYVQEAKRDGIKVHSPSLNNVSLTAFTKNNELFLPIQMIKGIGTTLANKIIIEFEMNGNYFSFFQAICRLAKNGLTSSTFEKLINANFFREFGNMKTLLLNMSKAEAYFKLVYNKKEDSLNFDLIKEPTLNIIEIDIEYESSNESKLLGMKFNTNMVDRDDTDGGVLLKSLTEGKSEIITVHIDKIYKKKSKNNRKYYKINISDSSKSVTVTYFGDDFDLMQANGFVENTKIKLILALNITPRFKNYKILGFESIEE